MQRHHLARRLGCSHTTCAICGPTLHCTEWDPSASPPGRSPRARRRALEAHCTDKPSKNDLTSGPAWGGGVKCCPACDWGCELVFFLLLLLLFSNCDLSFDRVHRLVPRYIKAEGACMHTHKDFCCSYFIFRNIGRFLFPGIVNTTRVLSRLPTGLHLVLCCWEFLLRLSSLSHSHLIHDCTEL